MRDHARCAGRRCAHEGWSGHVRSGLLHAGGRLGRSTHMFVEEIRRAAHHSRFMKLHQTAARNESHARADGVASLLRSRLSRQARRVSCPASRGSTKQNVSTWPPRWKPSTTNVPGSPRIRSRRADSGWFWMLTWPTLTISSPALTYRRHTTTKAVRCLRGPVGSSIRAAEGGERGEGAAAQLASSLACAAARPTMPLRHAEPPWTTSLTTICRARAAHASAAQTRSTRGFAPSLPQRRLARSARAPQQTATAGRAERDGGRDTCGG